MKLSPAAFHMAADVITSTEPNARRTELSSVTLKELNDVAHRFVDESHFMQQNGEVISFDANSVAYGVMVGFLAGRGSRT